MTEEIEKILSEIVEKLRHQYQPLKIVLFGSYASGTATAESDIDLLIVKQTDRNRIDRFVEVKRIIYNPSWKVPVSPLVYTPEEIEERLRLGDDFVREILEHGITLYEEPTGSRVV